MFKEKMLTIWNTYKSSKLAWGILIVVVIIIIVVVTKGSTTVSTGVATVTKGDVVDSVVLSGRTASASAVKLGFADQGRVSGVYVKEGDKVSKGQLLASIDTSDLYLNDIAKLAREQDALVANAYRNLLSSGLQVIPEDVTKGVIAATISGIYSGSEGDYKIRIYDSSSESGKSFEISGIENGSIQPITTSTAVPLG